jgi:hypothetical protein
MIGFNLKGGKGLEVSAHETSPFAGPLCGQHVTLGESHTL